VNSNNYGIRMSFSSDYNTIYHNNLINNTDHNAYDSGTNTWDSGSEGNYYADYTSTDPDGNGIGSDPHPIPGGSSIDRFPLMHPWTDTPPQKGDLNRDNQITPADAAITLQLAASGSASCDPATIAAADVSGDNRVTSLDALMILQAAAGTPAKVITWHYYDEGMEIAGAQNKPVMIEVYTIWCTWCSEMDRVIYTDQDVIDLADQFVCIKIDADERRDLAARYNPRGGVPTTVFVRSDDTEVHRISGYPRGGAEAFIQEMLVALSNV
jgi:thiol-disulfide isomerase/thioredoxin